ncbi:hypothetical protein PB1_02645 [Bacillus methanolicus PB1]|uniref:Uncharacterized protein n=1 Tax=Bacillus methanolicus PB1 TaxID=997296 RepID=I3E5N1_BACMT|nr:hypothetical protein PB1_02645 [Bacillus methanolicus PB1]
MSEIFISIHETIKEKGVIAILFKYLFILPTFTINICLVWLFTYLLKIMDFINTTDFFYYSIAGGFLWIISFYVATIFPNLPSKVLKKEQ